MLTRYSKVYLLLVIVGVAIRFTFVLAADSRHPDFLSGGSDAPVYVLLANNVIAGRGFSYAGQPSAFRPPGLPLLIAGSQLLFGTHYITAIRLFQLALGLLTIFVCSRISSHIAGPRAQRATMIVGLFLPTLIFSTAQLLTECISAFLTSLFLWLLVKQQENGDLRSASGLGVLAGLESLIRFDAAALPVFAAAAVIQSRKRTSMLPRILLIAVLTVLVVSPWFVRNEQVFQGQVLFSTHTGANMVQGVVTTQGRTQPGDTEKLKAAIGWSLWDLESNDARRLLLPSEVELNRHAIRVVPHLWAQEKWRALPLLGRKIADFWLSSDQFLDTQSLPLAQRVIRILGVLVYLVFLALALRGIFQLHKTQPGLASLFILYAVGFTALHLPFVMNTRLRIPLMEPLVVVLGGIGWTTLNPLSQRRRKQLDSLTRPESSESVPV
jgi:4-amino-4-deoxy-L-arabinose transferase-like glycosyltransferase